MLQNKYKWANASKQIPWSSWRVRPSFTWQFLFGDMVCMWTVQYQLNRCRNVCKGRYPGFYRIICFFLSIWVSFHKHSRFTGQPKKGEAISVTALRHFQLIHRHLDINRTITVENSPLHITSTLTRTGNLWFPSANY